jgi:sugar phosphate permease
MSQSANTAKVQQATQEQSYRWAILAVATVAQAGACFLVQGLGALAGYMQEALGLRAFEIGLLISAAQFVPIVGLLVAGELLDRFSERLIVGVGTLVVSAALAGASMATSYQALLVFLLIVGAGYSTAQPGGSKSVSIWFSSSQRGFAMGIRQAGLPLGGALAAATLPAIAGEFGWQAAFLTGAVAAFIGGILFIAVYRSPYGPRSAPGASLKSLLATRFALVREPSMQTIMWSGVTLIAAQYGLLIFVALDVRDRLGVSLETGAALLVVAQCAGVGGRIWLAAWSDRCRQGRYFPIVTCMWALVIGLLILLSISHGSTVWLGLLAAWLGFFGFGWYGPWVAYVTEAAPPDRVGFALGLAMAVNQIAIIASPPLLGLIRDATNSYVVNWAFLIAILLWCVLTTHGRRTRSKGAC